MPGNIPLVIKWHASAVTASGWHASSVAPEAILCTAVWLYLPSSPPFVHAGISAAVGRVACDLHRLVGLDAWSSLHASPALESDRTYLHVSAASPSLLVFQPTNCGDFLVGFSRRSGTALAVSAA